MKSLFGEDIPDAPPRNTFFGVLAMAKKSVKKSVTKERPVVVTTQHRGVFFGYATDTSGTTIQLLRARMCVYWSADMRGVFGLASMGPSVTCRISPAADVELRDITCVMEVTPEAVQQWEKAPWSR